LWLPEQLTAVGAVEDQANHEIDGDEAYHDCEHEEERRYQAQLHGHVEHLDARMKV
jgi:hypothetical protein